MLTTKNSHGLMRPVRKHTTSVFLQEDNNPVPVTSINITGAREEKRRRGLGTKLQRDCRARNLNASFI